MIMKKISPTDEILAAIRTTVGDDHAFALTSDAGSPYRAMFSPWLPDSQQPLVVAHPESVEQVQALVKLAGQQGFSIWTTANAAANGARLGNTEKPAVLLDLQRMNRVLEVDTQSATAPYPFPAVLRTRLATSR